MSSMKSIRGRDATTPDRGPIPFPTSRQASRSSASHGRPHSRPLMPESIDDMLATFDTMSRRINDLARELNCLGHFDDPNNDLPRAA